MIFPVFLSTFSDGCNYIISNPVLLSYAFGGLALIWLVLVVFIKQTNKGKWPPLPPGPKPLPLLGNLLSLDLELHTHFAKLSESYGPILTLWLGKKPAIVITSPCLSREVLKDQDATFANRDVPVAGLEASYGGSNIVSAPNGPEWRMLRGVCVREMLCNATLDSVYVLRRREVRQTIQFFYSQAGKPVYVGEQIFLTILNVITNMLWGGTVKGDERTSIASEFRQAVSGITQCLMTPNISDFFPSLERLDLQGIQKKTRILAGKLDDIFERLIDQRMKEEGGDDVETESRDFLQLLLKLKDERDSVDSHSNSNAPPLTMIHVKALLMDMVVGGTDGTSNTIEFALAELMNKPEILSKVQQELETVVGKDRTVEESDIHKLPYLYAVMKEVLRLHPTLPLMVPHCPSETSIVGGYTIPKGARVFVNIWAIHRDPSIWENASEFCPERFLDSSLDYTGKNFSYLPFGSGRRRCAGIAMGERMFMFLLASFLHSFDWKVPEGESLELEEKFGIVLKKKNPLVAIPTPRLPDASLYDIA